MSRQIALRQSLQEWIVLSGVSDLGLWERKLCVAGVLIDNCHSRGQQPCTFLRTRNVLTCEKKFPTRFGRRLQNGHCDVMKLTITRP